MMTTRTMVMNPKQVTQRLNRLAWQVYEHCYDQEEIIVAGIEPNGFRLADMIAKILGGISPLKVQLCQVKLNKDAPLDGSASISIAPEKLEGKTVIVVDDVSNSGRTLMYAVKMFLDAPVRSVLTLVLVDRDHNRFPVKTNFVGLSLATTLQEHITVEASGKGEIAVFLD